MITFPPRKSQHSIEKDLSLLNSLEGCDSYSIEIGYGFKFRRDLVFRTPKISAPFGLTWWGKRATLCIVADPDEDSHKDFVVFLRQLEQRVRKLALARADLFNGEAGNFDIKASKRSSYVRAGCTYCSRTMNIRADKAAKITIGRGPEVHITQLNKNDLHVRATIAATGLFYSRKRGTFHVQFDLLEAKILQ